MDGIHTLSPEARLLLTGQLKLTGNSKPTRRVWIPKPGKADATPRAVNAQGNAHQADEKRPLGIPIIYDRALQGVVKLP